MKREEMINLAKGTADAAYVLDPNGLIVAWNDAAEGLFGVSAEMAIGQHCSDVLRGIDECGRRCGGDCTVKEHAFNCEPLKSYDIQVDTLEGRKWCSMSVIMAGKSGSAAQYTLHVARSADLRKRMESLLRDFVVSETSLPVVNVREIVSVKRSTTEMADISKREIDVLRLLAKGESTAEIAARLFISPTTVNNHVQRILKKLSAHSRLEAVRRAEKARLI